jgi:alcohol dehydrogenase (cytochrome c)
VWHGQNRKLLLHADRNGFFYVLDRTNGKFLAATAFVYQNWNRGFESDGRPILVPGSNSSPEGSFLVYPSLAGGTNFQAPSYSPVTGWLYLEYAERGQQFISATTPYEAGRQYIGRGRGNTPAPDPKAPVPSGGIRALDPETGKTMWDFKLPQSSLNNGVMATAGGVLFAASRDGSLLALDASNGKELGHFSTGGNMSANPMSFAVDGRQYIAVAANAGIYCFGLE